MKTKMIDMINELKGRGYSLRHIHRHTGISMNRLGNFIYHGTGTPSYAEYEAFREYHEKALGLFAVYREAHERYLSQATLQGQNKNALEGK